MTMKAKYIIMDGSKFVTVIMDDTPCTSLASTSQFCGGCSECLRAQAEYAGFDVINAKTMNEEYHDGSDDDHTVCPVCGFCISCGDCENLGCGAK